MAERQHLDPRLYVLVGGPADPADAPTLARAAIEGGATWLQVRAKGMGGRAMVALAREVCTVAQPAGVRVLVNDRADVAHAAGADGVHLGPEDLSVAAARALLGPAAIVGFSAGTPAEAEAAEAAGADYLGVGDVFGTRTKPDADEPIGLRGLTTVVRATELPCVAIGGVNARNAAAAIGAGARGVAVASAVVRARDPVRAVRRLRSSVDAALPAAPARDASTSAKTEASTDPTSSDQG